MELQIISSYYNMCKECNSVKISEDRIKEFRKIKEGIKEKTDDLIVEINRTIRKLKKLQNEFGMNSVIKQRIDMIINMKIMAIRIKKKNKALLKNEEKFKCDDCKCICEIEHIYADLQRGLIYLASLDYDYFNTSFEDAEMCGTEKKDEKVNKRIKEIFEIEGDFNNIGSAFFEMEYRLKKLQEFIIKENVCKNIPENEKNKILENVQQYYIIYENYSKHVTKTAENEIKKEKISWNIVPDENYNLFLLCSSNEKKMKKDTGVNFKDVFQECIEEILKDSNIEYKEDEIAEILNRMLKIYIKIPNKNTKINLLESFVNWITNELNDNLLENHSVEIENSIYIINQYSFYVTIMFDFKKIAKLAILNQRIRIVSYYSTILKKQIEMDLPEIKIIFKPNKVEEDENGNFLIAEKILNVDFISKRAHQ